MTEPSREPAEPALKPTVPSSQANPRSRWVAIVTGAISVLIGVLYLLLITVLDSRGPLRPPPPEALGSLPMAEAVSAPDAAAAAPPPG